MELNNEQTKKLIKTLYINQLNEIEQRKKEEQFWSSFRAGTRKALRFLLFFYFGVFLLFIYSCMYWS